MSTSREQVYRSSVTGARPSAGVPGWLYTNWADRQLGTVQPDGIPMDLLGITIFSTSADYGTGALVVHEGDVYQARAFIAAGAWNVGEWWLLTGTTYIGAGPPAADLRRPGSLWLDTTTSLAPVLRVWDGSATYLDTSANKLPLAGGSMTGDMSFIGAAVAGNRDLNFKSDLGVTRMQLRDNSLNFSVVPYNAAGIALPDDAVRWDRTLEAWYLGALGRVPKITTTILIPTDFPTLQAAFDSLKLIPTGIDGMVEVRIASSHQLTAGLKLIGGDYSRVKITSEGNTLVTLAGGFAPVIASVDDTDAERDELNVDPHVSNPTTAAGSGACVFYFCRCRAPLLDIRLDCNNLGGDAIRATQGAQVSMARRTGTTNGIIDAQRFALHAQSGAVIHARECSFSSPGEGAARASGGSFINMQAASVSGAAGSFDNTDAAICALNGATIDAAGSSITTGQRLALRADRATLVAQGIAINNLVAVGWGAVLAEHGALISVANGDISTVSLLGVPLDANGGTIDAGGADLTGNSSTIKMRVRNGGLIRAVGATGAGSTRIAFSGPVNAVDSRGGIFYDGVIEVGLGSDVLEFPDSGSLNTVLFNGAVRGGTTVTSSPSGASSFTVFNLIYDEDRTSQLAVSLEAAPQLFIRAKHAGGWSAWTEVHTAISVGEYLQLKTGGSSGDPTLRFGTNAMTGIHVAAAQEELIMVADGENSFIQNHNNPPRTSSTLMTRQMCDDRYVRS